jgi:ABC-type dipeptide/oligopeptide/nickel transport system permease component
VIRYGIRRLVHAVPTLLVISFLTFAMLRLIPGDPAMLIAGEEATPDALAAIRERLGLDRPLYEQYGRYLAALLRGDLGTSIRTKGSVADELAARIPATLELAVTGALVMSVVGAGLGVAAATWTDRWPDHVVRGLSLIAVSTPSFWLGALLVWIFAVQLGLLPVAGRGSLAFLILPAATVSLDGIALLGRLVRTSLLEVLEHDYIRTAWAKGLPDRAVVGRHALRAALIPVVTVVGLEFGRLLGGVVVVESVFGWPGLGRLLINAIHARDYPLVQSGILVFSATLIAVNVVVDVLVGVLDPRVRYP